MRAFLLPVKPEPSRGASFFFPSDMMLTSIVVGGLGMNWRVFGFETVIRCLRRGGGRLMILVDEIKRNLRGTRESLYSRAGRRITYISETSQVSVTLIWDTFRC